MDIASISSAASVLLIIGASFLMIMGLGQSGNDKKLYALWLLGLAILINTNQILAKLP